MSKGHDNWIRQLNKGGKDERLSALSELRREQDMGKTEKPVTGHDVNSHIHTTYSFSPYTPSGAAWQAFMAGLATAGIMDHDTIAGAEEFIEAGHILDLPVTIGSECRVSFAATKLAGRRLNNPDQKGLAYVALHGVPRQKIGVLTEFFRPVREMRFRRNLQMTERLNEILIPIGISLDFAEEIIPLSQWQDGGEITERHILYALARKLLASCEDRDRILQMLSELGLAVSEKIGKLLLDPSNRVADYDLLGVLKSNLVERFYINAAAECPPVREMADFCRENGIILAYAYLGDVTESVTGDKKAQEFEDSYLEELFSVLRQEGFQAVTYMPSRNSTKQLSRLKKLCEEFEFFQISGEDINQPRQEFICTAMRDPFFANLYDSAWALIGHEKLSGQDLDLGMFSAGTQNKFSDLEARIKHFSDAGSKLWNK